MTGQPTIMYLMKQVTEAARARMETALEPVGLDALQYTALSLLELRMSTPEQLARASFVRVRRANLLIDGLDERGLIQRVGEQIALSPAGRQVLEKFGDRILKIEREMLAELTGADVAKLRGYLLECRVAL